MYQLTNEISIIEVYFLVIFFEVYHLYWLNFLNRFIRFIPIGLFSRFSWCGIDSLCFIYRGLIPVVLCLITGYWRFVHGARLILGLFSSFAWCGIDSLYLIYRGLIPVVLCLITGYWRRFVCAARLIVGLFSSFAWCGIDSLCLIYWGSIHISLSLTIRFILATKCFITIVNLISWDYLRLTHIIICNCLYCKHFGLIIFIRCI